MKKLFICGCGHSGTSLMQAIMLTHSQCTGIREESELFLHNNESKAVPYMQDIELKNVDNSCKYIIEKTPRHVRMIDNILDVFSDVTFLICYRNPLDVVGSLKKRGFTLDDAIERFNNDNIAWISNKHRQNFIEVCYEDFVKNPTHLLISICNRLGIQFENTMLDYWKLDETYFNIDKIQYYKYANENLTNNIEDFKRDEGINHLLLRNYQLRQPVSDMSGSWKIRLSKTESCEVMEKTADVAKLLGYDLFNC